MTSPTIPIKSPLALTGVFLQVIRERFAPSQNLDWVWYPGDEGRQNSTITIEAARNPQSEDFGNRAAIYVSRNPISYAQTNLRDLVDRDVRTDSETFYCMAQTGFTFSCESEMQGEAEILADVVLSTLLMGSDEIERMFGFKKLGPFAISAAGVTRQDTEINRVDVQMGLSFDVRWASNRIAPILRELAVKAGGTYSSGEDYFIEIYQSSLNVRPSSP